MRFRAFSMLTSRRETWRYLPVALLLAMLPAPRLALAQVLYGSLTGNVTDATSTAVPGAKVEALNVGTGISKQTVSDDRGVYLINDLQAGAYRVTIGAAAFGSIVQENVQLD